MEKKHFGDTFLGQALGLAAIFLVLLSPIISYYIFS